MTLESISSITPPPPIREIDKETARKRILELKQKQQERMMTSLSPEEKEKQRNEILELNPDKVLVVCHAGVFRSGMVAEILRGRGYEASNTGTMNYENTIKQDLEEYDAFIFMSQDRADEFRSLYNIDTFSKPIRIIGIAESANLHDSTTKEIEIKSAETKLDDLGFVTKLETQ